MNEFEEEKNEEKLVNFINLFFKYRSYSKEMRKAIDSMVNIYKDPESSEEEMIMAFDTLYGAFYSTKEDYIDLEDSEF